MKVILKLFLTIALAILILAGGFLGYLAFTEYKPQDVIPVQLINQQDKTLAIGDEITITSFNIGYAALDRDTDFFLDGGTMSRGISQERVQENLGKVISFLKEQNSDLYLIQEVDEKSTRSYSVNQKVDISELPGYSSSYGINYQVGWVPVPLKEPMGKVLSGIMTLSKLTVDETFRHTLPGQYSWPTRLAHLNRCMLETRIPLEDDTELVIGHIHLSAYDEGGFIRNQQLTFLQEFARREYEKGNYVILGGDWNHLLAENPQEKRARYSAVWPDWLQLLPADFLSEFVWAFDEVIPSNRSVEAPYDPKNSFVVTIDGFLVSPNIEVIEVYGHDLQFDFSDHNPVTTRLRLGQLPEAEPSQDDIKSISEEKVELDAQSDH